MKRRITISMTILLVFSILVMEWSSFGSLKAKEETELSDEPIELASLRELNGKHFLRSDGTVDYEVYASRVHYLDQNNEYQEISNRLIEEPTKIRENAYVYRNEANDMEIRLADDTSNCEFPVYFHWNDYQIFMGFEGNSSQTDREYKAPEVMEELYDPEACIVYSDIYPFVDYMYEVRSSEIKENLILWQKPEQTEFAFIYQVEGGLTFSENDNEVVLLNAEGKEVLTIGSLYAYDSNKAISQNIGCSVKTLGENQYRVVITIDEEWINDEERAFPVVVDPSVQITDYKFIYDTCVCSFYPTTNFNIGNDNLYLRAGKDTDYGIRRSYIRFYINPYPINGSAINSATIRLYREGYSGTPTLRSYRVTTSWNPSSITWNNQPSYSSTPSPGPSSNLGNRWYDVIVTDIVKGWFNNTYTNYGVMIKDYYEDNTNQWSTFYSSDNTPGLQPKLVINYTASYGNYTAVVMAGACDDADDCKVYYDELTAMGYSAIHPGWSALAYPNNNGLETSNNLSVTENTFISGGDKTVCVFSGHGGESGGHPVLSYGYTNAFDVATHLGVSSNSSWQNDCVWNNKPVETLILAACSQLDAYYNMYYYGRIMKASNLKAVLGYHEPTDSGESDVMVARCFMMWCRAAAGFSIKYCWEYANSSSDADTQQWAILVYSTYQGYQMPGFPGYSSISHNKNNDVILRFKEGNSQEVNPYIILNNRNESGDLPEGEFPLYVETRVDPEFESQFSRLTDLNRNPTDSLTDMNSQEELMKQIVYQFFSDEQLENVRVEMSDIVVDTLNLNEMNLLEPSIKVGEKYSIISTFNDIPINNSFMKFSVDKDGIYMAINNWKEITPGEERILVNQNSLETALKKVEQQGLKVEAERTKLIYKPIDETKCKLCYRIVTNSTIVYVDLETGEQL